MSLYSYTALNEQGARVTGTQEAGDKLALSHQLKAEGKTLLSATEQNKKGVFDMSKINAFLSTVKMQEKIIVARNLSAMLRAGLSVARGISILERQTKNPKLKITLTAINEHIKNGNQLSDGLSKFPNIFPPLFISMVKAGEESGTLAGSLRTISDQMEKTYLLQKKIKGALIYPGVIVSAMILVGILMLIFVVPTLTTTFTELDVELPKSTQIIILISTLLQEQLILLILGLIIFGLSLYGIAKTEKGKRGIDFFVLHIPVIGNLIKQANAARTARTLSSLLGSGVHIVESLRITREVLQNSYYKEVLLNAEGTIQKGTPLSDVFKKSENIYPILVGEMVEVGEETGKLSDMLGEVATFYENEVEDITKNMSTIIEPFLMVAVGAGVGFFAISMISPMYSLLNNI